MHTITAIVIEPGLAAKARRALGPLTRTLSNAYRRWLRARQTRATARALDLLDDRLLHDIGLDRSEVLSIAAELHGQVARERRHAWLMTSLPR